MSEIDGGAFRYCTNLSSLTNLARNPQRIDESVFDSYRDLHVLKGCKEAYQKAEVWKKFNIIEDAEEILGISNIGSETIAADKVFSLGTSPLSSTEGCGHH